MSELLQGPLQDQHVAAGAKFAEFSGWSMPVEYAGGGVLAEHAAVREAVGLFDVSHLGKAVVAGPGAVDFVNRCLANDLNRIEPGRSQYTLCCNAAGGVVDDLIAYLRSPEEVFLIPNAANTATVVSLLNDAAPEGVTITDQHRDHAVLAVQGPKVDELFERLGLPHGHDYMSFVDAELNGASLTVCRTGYTGERGYELVTPWDSAPAVWDAVLAGVQELGGRPAGLGARDTLRTEMGYALHGHELSTEITPLQGGVSWAVGWKKDAFWGRDALVAEKASGPARKLFGILATGRGVPRGGLTVKNAAGEEIGTTTSGTFSPSLKQGIALALLRPDTNLDDEITIDVRGRALSGVVKRPPFVPDHARD